MFCVFDIYCRINKLKIDNAFGILKCPWGVIQIVA
jgi:hypothetical protein